MAKGPGSASRSPRPEGYQRSPDTVPLATTASPTEMSTRARSPCSSRRRRGLAPCEEGEVDRVRGGVLRQRPAASSFWMWIAGSVVTEAK